MEFMLSNLIARLLAAGIAAGATLSVAAGDAHTRAWPVAGLAAADADTVVLSNRHGVVLQRLETARLRQLYAVKTALEAVAETHAELLLVDGDSANAFAGEADDRGAVVAINFAMLELLDHDLHAAAALLGHELAHLKLRHAAEGADSEARSTTLSMLGGAVLNSLGVPAGDAISGLTVHAIQSSYNREQEREADYLGAIWAVEAGFEAHGAVRLHERMQLRNGAAASPFFATHPAGPERIASLKALARRLSP